MKFLGRISFEPANKLWKGATERPTLAVFVIGTALLLLVWVLVKWPGPGTYAFWEWQTESWQAVATAITGLALACLAAGAWRLQQIQTEILAQRVNPIMALSEAQTPKVAKLYLTDKTFAADKNQVTISGHGFEQVGLVWVIRALNPGDVSLRIDKFQVTIARDAGSDRLTSQDHNLKVYRIRDNTNEIRGWVSRAQMLDSLSHLTLAFFIPKQVVDNKLSSPLGNNTLEAHVSYTTFAGGESSKLSTIQGTIVE